MSNENFVRGWYTPDMNKKKWTHLDKITIKGVQYYLKKKTDGGNTMVVLEKKRLGVVGEIRESEGGVFIYNGIN